MGVLGNSEDDPDVRHGLCRNRPALPTNEMRIDHSLRLSFVSLNDDTRERMLSTLSGAFRMHAVFSEHCALASFLPRLFGTEFECLHDMWLLLPSRGVYSHD